MHRLIALCLLLMVPAYTIAGTKESGTTALKDVQPAGTTNKQQKHQQYDLFFGSASGRDYTCRTSEKTSVKATDLVVGSTVTYEVNGNKGKVKTATGKQLSCTIVRVANVSTAPK
jgi:phage gp45-like